MSHDGVLGIDPDVLEKTAQVVENYCKAQNYLLQSFLTDVSNLSGSWQDDATMGSLLREITQLKSDVSTIMDTVATQYPRYFREKAAVIRARPKLG